MHDRYRLSYYKYSFPHCASLRCRLLRYDTRGLRVKVSCALVLLTVVAPVEDVKTETELQNYLRGICVMHSVTSGR